MNSFKKSESKFSELIEIVETSTQCDMTVVCLLKKYYSRTNLHFLRSEDFFVAVDECIRKIGENPENKYVHIKEFVDDLKEYKSNRRKRIQEDVSEISDSDSVTSDSASIDWKSRGIVIQDNVESERKRAKFDNGFHEQAVEKGKIKEKSKILLSTPVKSGFKSEDDDIQLLFSKKSSEGVEQVDRSLQLLDRVTFKTSDVDQMEANVLNNNFSDCKISKSFIGKSGFQSKQTSTATKDLLSLKDSVTPRGLHDNLEKQNSLDLEKHQSRVKRLENLLQKIHKKIQELQESEQTLDEMETDDTAYLEEDRYKKKFVKVWNKLCQVTKRPVTTGRPIEKKFTFEEPRYPEIKEMVCLFINKYKVFPDYQDIHSIVEKCNVQHSLNMSKSLMIDVAKKIFLDVGHDLQKRRKADFKDLLGCHLTDHVRSYDDPALIDAELRKKLLENEKIAKTRLNEVIDRYTYGEDKEENEEDSKTEDNEKTEDEDESEENQSDGLSDMEDIEACCSLGKVEPLSKSGKVVLIRHSQDHRDENRLCNGNVEISTEKVETCGGDQANLSRGGVCFVVGDVDCIDLSSDCPGHKRFAVDEAECEEIESDGDNKKGSTKKFGNAVKNMKSTSATAITANSICSKSLTSDNFGTTKGQNRVQNVNPDDDTIAGRKQNHVLNVNLEDSTAAGQKQDEEQDVNPDDDFMKKVPVESETLLLSENVRAKCISVEPEIGFQTERNQTIGDTNGLRERQQSETAASNYCRQSSEIQTLGEAAEKCVVLNSSENLNGLSNCFESDQVLPSYAIVSSQNIQSNGVKNVINECYQSDEAKNDIDAVCRPSNCLPSNDTKNDAALIGQQSKNSIKDVNASFRHQSNKNEKSIDVGSSISSLQSDEVLKNSILSSKECSTLKTSKCQDVCSMSTCGVERGHFDEDFIEIDDDDDDSDVCELIEENFEKSPVVNSSKKDGASKIVTTTIVDISFKSDDKAGSHTDMSPDKSPAVEKTLPADFCLNELTSVTKDDSSRSIALLAQAAVEIENDVLSVEDAIVNGSEKEGNLNCIDVDGANVPDSAVESLKSSDRLFLRATVDFRKLRIPQSFKEKTRDWLMKNTPIGAGNQSNRDVIELSDSD